MECPNCGCEMAYSDWYYTGNYSAGQYQKKGDIYRCNNYEWFDDPDEAKAYLEANNLEVGKGKDFETLEEVCCGSAEWDGHFYTDERDELYEGYPC